VVAMMEEKKWREPSGKEFENIKCNALFGKIKFDDVDVIDERRFIVEYLKNCINIFYEKMRSDREIELEHQKITEIREKISDITDVEETLNIMYRVIQEYQMEIEEEITRR